MQFNSVTITRQGPDLTGLVVLTEKLYQGSYPYHGLETAILKYTWCLRYVDNHQHHPLQRVLSQKMRQRYNESQGQNSTAYVATRELCRFSYDVTTVFCPFAVQMREKTEGDGTRCQGGKPAGADSRMQKPRNPSKFQLMRLCLYKQPLSVA